MTKKYIFTSILLATMTSVMAQSETKEKSIELNPVVVTGTGTFRHADNSPVAVKVITAKELRDANVTSLTEAFSRLTSNITSHTNGMGEFINFNGVSDDYILILLNGKRVSGDDKWNRISLDNIKRIEILPGAASALYGSDALAGVINVITDENKAGVSASSRTNFTSKGRFNQDINVDANIGKLSSFTTYSHRQADAWQVNKYQEFTEKDATTGEDISVAKLTGRPMSQAFRSENLDQRLEYRFNSKFDVYAKGNYYDYITLRDHAASYFKQSQDKTTGAYKYTSTQAYTYDLHHVSFNLGAGARWVPNKNSHIYFDIYTDNFASDYDYWQTATAEAYSETRKKTHYYNETLRGIFRLNSWNKLSGGIELEQNRLHSQSDNISGESTSTSNIFVQDELNLAKGLEAVVGLRYTYNNNFGSHVTPNVALFYRISGVSLRASYAGGYRTPTLSQLYATDQAKTTSRYTMNNTELKPEKNDFFNLNAEYSNKWMTFSVSAFQNDIRDMINYRTLTEEEILGNEKYSAIREDGWKTIRQRDNIDRATIKGLSANVKFIMPCGFALSGGYTYTDSKAKTKTLNTKTQEYETTESPVDKSVHNVANAALTWDHSWGIYHLNVNLNGHIQSRRYSSTYGYAPEYSQWNITTSHTIRLKSCTLQPTLGIDNIFNKRDTSYWNSNFSTINPGRALVVGCSLKI